MKLLRALITMGIVSALLLGTLGAQERGLNAVARQIVGKTDFDIGKQYALIIGIDKYKEWTPLKDAVSEAKKVKEILERRYYIDEFIEMYDNDATAANIRKMLTQTLPAKVGKNDSLLIFYAGHGNLDESKTGSWIAVDGTTDPFDQKGWIPNQQLRNMISLVKAQRVLVMADACFSGDFLNTSRGTAPVINNTYYQTALQKTARQVLTSGASETVPDQSEFGASLLNMLERNNDPVLDTNAMFVKIRTSVTKTQPLIGTIPGDDNGTFALFLKPQFGLVRLSSIADAKILLDDTEVGTISAGATITLPKMAAGSHNLSLVIGSQKDTKQIVLAPDQELAVSFNFKPVLPGAIAVTAAAPAEVFLDGKSVGQIVAGTALTLDKLIEGDHLVSLKYRDNQEDRKVTVLGGQTSPVSFNYAPEPLGSVKFAGFPEGSVITAAGRELGVIDGGELTVRNIKVGSRSFQISNELWADTLSLKASVTDGATALVKFAGAAILVDKLPAGTALSVDGQVVAKAVVDKKQLVVGPFPEGDHSVSVSGGDYENFRQTVSLTPGKDFTLALKLTPRDTGPATPTPAPNSVGTVVASNIAYLNIKKSDNQKEVALDLRVVRKSTGEVAKFTPETKGQLVLEPDLYTLLGRLPDDEGDGWIMEVDLRQGGIRNVQIPIVEYSLLHRANVATQKYKKVQATRDGLDVVGEASRWLAFASTAAALYGLSAGYLLDYPAYKAATTKQEALRLHNALNLDQNLVIFGGLGTAYFWLQSLIGLVPTPELAPARREMLELRMQLNAEGAE